MKELLCRSRNDIAIVYDPQHSHAATHFGDSPTLKPAVITALQNSEVQGQLMFFEYDLGTSIGTTDLVETTAEDEIVYAKRKNRDTYTRFTTSQRPRDCATVTICLERLNDAEYNLASAWIGYIGPSFPGDINETPDSREYWSKHALVWGRQEIQPGTSTAICPWQPASQDGSIINDEQIA